ncbi:MAG: RusA family crossover junction endodeoxyribonuclease [Syntrophales bacterium]|nr:RusA family crossover junction endodeoxyribonuclease [Syntrophales bacterium]
MTKGGLRWTEEQLADYQKRHRNMPENIPEPVKHNDQFDKNTKSPVHDFFMQTEKSQQNITGQTYDLLPVPKPRMTRRDKWKLRSCVVKYRAFCDQARALGINLPFSGAHIVFVLPMPASWSKKKRAEYLGRPHQSKPDLDNMIKALADALHKEDSGLWDIHATKIWGERGEIRITG